MKDENELVSPDELVLRLIWRDFFIPESAQVVRERAFLPRKDEADGISVFRAACLDRPERSLDAMAPEKRGKYAVAQLAVADLTRLGLTVRPARIDAVPGHAVLPELNFTAWQGERQRWKDVVLELIALAERGIIRLPTEGRP